MYMYYQSLIQVESTSSISLVLFHVHKVHSIHIFKFLSMNKLHFCNSLFTLENKFGNGEICLLISNDVGKYAHPHGVNERAPYSFS